VAPPGASAHEYGEAFDYVVTPNDYQPDVGATWQSWGGVWGGKKDVVHFELPGAGARALARYQEEQQSPWWYDIGTALLPSKSLDVMQSAKDPLFVNPVTKQKESLSQIFSSWWNR
jgi:hypothetical protein